MTSLRKSTTTLTSLALLSIAGSCAVFGCDGKDPKQSGAPTATGGRTAQGGGGTSAAPGGGATLTAIGGNETGVGGEVSSGGETASGGSAGSTSVIEQSGGASVAGSTSTTPTTACASDIDCKAIQQLCNVTLKHCVQCLQTADCRDGSACVGGVCGGTPGCKSNSDCATSSEGKACDVARGRCVACVTAADCPNPSTSECVNQVCSTVVTCVNSLDCTSASAPICNRSVTPGRCVPCVADADCSSSSSGKTCSDNQCRTSCSSNSDCSSGSLCNTSIVPNVCAACATASDCPAAQYCSKGACVADVCTAGVDQACISNGIATCKADGDGFGSPQTCPSGQACTATASRATCGTGTTLPPPTTCATSPGTVNPCTKIPVWSGTQVVDAKGDDFCGIPAFELNFKNAAGVNNNKVSGGSTADFTQRAIAQVAWSPEAFRAYVEVIGTPVRSNTALDKFWDGDSIELMITTSGSATGVTANDANALHIIANYSGGATVKSDATSGTPTALSSSQFAGQKTTQGYAIEVMVPWRGSPSLASAATMRFDMAMNVDTASVDPTVQGRDAQAVLAMTPVTGNSSCSGSPTPFCDDRLWCPTTLE